MKKTIKIIIFLIISILILNFILRLISPTEIDDINPNIKCEKDYLNKSDILWIIPKYKNIPISENKSWCNQILKLNKTLGMHGITHSYHEFKTNITNEQIIQAKQIFKDCFGQEPELFKPPYLKISKENKKLIEKNNMKIKLFLNQNIHKVYHCQDTGVFPNRFHDIF